MKRNKKAFTLAEMLATFAIIATIAGIFMSRFNNVSPKENIMNYKKAYFTIQQVVAQLANDRELFPSEDNGFMINGTRNADGTITFEGGLETPTLVASSNYFCRELVRNLNTIGDLTTACTEFNEATGAGIITLSNGVQLLNVGGQEFELPANANNYTQECIDIIVDTNGQKGPNSMLASDNRDRFRIRIFFEGKVTTAPTWVAENAIFEAGTKAQNLNLREFPDAQ